MRVIYSIGAKFAGGGIGTTAYHAVRGLHRHGMLYRLLCGSFRPSEIPREKIRALGLPSRALRKLAVYDRTYYLDYVHNVLYDLWATRHIDACHLFHGWNGFSLRSLKRAKAFGAVTVVERASAHPLFQVRLLQEEYRRRGLSFRYPATALRRSVTELGVADYVTIPSDFVRRSFVERGFSPTRLIQIPFGVDIHRFRPVADRRSHPFRLLYVGQVSIQKGILYLLQAWERLRWSDAELWIVGRVERDISSLLQPYCRAPGIQWWGFVRDPVAAYQQADVFVFPSLQEGSALVTYEALACGLPVITTPNTGSVVRDGVEGFIVPIRDVETLAARLEQLRADERLRREMGRAARQRAEAFSWERYGDRLAEAIRHLRDRR